MPEPHCFGSLQTVAVRVAALDANGSPSPGASKGYVTDAVIEATVGVEVEEGDEFTLKNGWGGICATYKDCDRVKRVTVEMTLCQLDGELLSLLVGGSNIADLGGAGVGNSIGYELGDIDDACANGVCLEIWTKAWDGTSQATPAFAGGNTVVYHHFVMPKVKFQLGDLKFENDFMQVPVKGFGDSNPRITANGPYDDWSADIVARGGITNSLGWFMDATLPVAACGFKTVSSAAS